jgi:hypothetical protein
MGCPALGIWVGFLKQKKLYLKTNLFESGLDTLYI